jgi:hypothetical protein
MIPPRIAELIAKEEGYGIPGAIPTTHDNPGDLRHSPHSFHAVDAPNAIGEIDTPADGWYDLVHELDLYATRGMTIAQAIYEWAPPNENNTAAYLSYIVNGLGCSPDTELKEALTIPGIGAYSDEPTGEPS